MKPSRQTVGKDHMPTQYHSMILQRSPHYQGPIPCIRLPFYQSFSQFRLDPLYLYPTLTYASTKTINNQAIIPISEFSQPISADLTSTLNEICQQSPFKSLEHTSPEVTYSSLNTVEFGADRLESEANKLSSTKKALIKQILKDIGKKDEIFSSECSVNLDISDSLNFECSSQRSLNKHSYSSLSSRSIFSITETYLTVIPTNEEELMTCSKESCLVELIPEATNEFSFIRQSTDNSGIDEGSVNVSTRVFLPKTSASKNILNATPKGASKLIKEFEVVVKDINLIDIQTPNGLSPIYRKIVICGPGATFRSLEIRASIATSGFTSTVGLEFSNIENQSRGIINNKESKIIRMLPMRITEDLSIKGVSWISFGFEHCCILTVSGEVYSWGYGASGCLGLGSLLPALTPTLVPRLPKIIYIECGAYHTAVISQAEELYVWGRGDVNQLGVPSRNLIKDQLGCFAPFPIKNEAFAGKVIKGIACGEAHTLVLIDSGAVYSFGWAEDGQLGLPSNWIQNNYMSFEPRQIVYIKHKKIVKVAAGAVFSSALTDRGEIYVWGNGELGQLGLGNERKMLELPSIVAELQNEVIVDIVCGEAHAICVSKNGTLYGWGQGVAGIFESKSNLFPYGSELVCYLPRRLVEIDISHRIVIR